MSLSVVSSPPVGAASPPAAAPAPASNRTSSPPASPLSPGVPSASSSSMAAFPVYSAFDLASAFQSRAGLIYIMNNITLTNAAFPANLSLTIGQTRNVTIAPAPNITTNTYLLLNYYFPSLDATPTDTFLPFFSVLPGALINCTAVRFQIDPARCASGPNYAATSNTLRLAWLQSEHPELLSWRFLDNNLTIEVDTARVSQNFQRLNASFAQPVSGSGDIEISIAIFFCASTLQGPAANSSEKFSVASSSMELYDHLERLDSRTIYIDDNITVPTEDWPMNIVIANYRQVVVQSALPDLPESPGNDTFPSQLHIESNHDVLEAGYGGNLTFSDINLLFDSVCCTSKLLLGSWYVNQQALTGSLFNDLLPGALNVLSVHIAGLAPPAYLSMQNVQLWYKKCDSTRFPRIANSLINAMNSNAASNSNASYSDGHSVSCANCVFQGTASKPANFSQPLFYSVVQLVNTTINCGSFVNIALPPMAAPTPSLAMIEGGTYTPPSATSPAYSPPADSSRSQAAAESSSFTPQAQVVAPVVVAICVAVVASVAALWAFLQRDYRRLQASYGQLLDQSASSEDSGPTNGPLSLQQKALGELDR
ncbi:hypothetical protein WJX74_006966 [Apatococcus lobatus]|uniref:Uncharacterized protein n=1 Tax=Apatococcus lobatus TaxID=904363 RepID=A0AAW1QLY8_9CHLO